MNKRIRSHVFLGISLIVLGALLLLHQLHYVGISKLAIFWGVLVALGLYKVVAGFTRNGQGAWFGTMLVGVGGYYLLDEYSIFYLPSYLHLPAFVVLIGAGIFMSFLASPRRWHLLVPSLLLIGLGTVMILSEQGYFDRWEVIDAIRMWWPVALILFGAALLLNRNRPQVGQGNQSNS